MTENKNKGSVQHPYLKKIYDYGIYERGKNAGFCINSEKFNNLRYQIIDKNILIKSSYCGALSIDLKNIFAFIDELMNVVEEHGNL